VSRRGADFAERKEHFAGEAHLHTVAQTAGWSAMESDAPAELRSDGLEPAVQCAMWSDGTRDWVAGSDGTPDLIAGASHYCVAPGTNTKELPRIVLRIVRCAALRIEPLLTSGIAGRTVRERLVGTGAALCAGLVILRMREGIVALSVAVLDCTIVVG